MLVLMTRETFRVEEDLKKQEEAQSKAKQPIFSV
jgi:hypothetical protein